MTDQDRIKTNVINEITRVLNKGGIKYLSYTEGDNIEFYYSGFRIALVIKKDNTKDLKG